MWPAPISILARLNAILEKRAVQRTSVGTIQQSSYKFSLTYFLYNVR